MPFEDLGIDGYAVAGAYPQPVTLNNVFERCVIFRPVRQDPPRRFWCEIEQCTDGITRPFAGAQLEHLTDKDQRNDHNRSFVICPDALAVSIRFGENAGQECCGKRIDIGSPDAKRDQGPHVRRYIPDRFPPPFEEGKSRPENDRGCEDEFDVDSRLMSDPFPHR